MSSVSYTLNHVWASVMLKFHFYPQSHNRSSKYTLSKLPFRVIIHPSPQWIATISPSVQQYRHAFSLHPLSRTDNSFLCVRIFRFCKYSVIIHVAVATTWVLPEAETFLLPFSIFFSCTGYLQHLRRESAHEKKYTLTRTRILDEKSSQHTLCHIPLLSSQCFPAEHPDLTERWLISIKNFKLVRVYASIWWLDE